MLETLYFTIFSRMDNLNANNYQKLIIVIYTETIYKYLNLPSPWEDCGSLSIPGYHEYQILHKLKWLSSQKQNMIEHGLRFK